MQNFDIRIRSMEEANFISIREFPEKRYPVFAKKILKFLDEYHSQILKKLVLRLNHKKLQYFFGNRACPHTQELKSLIISIEDNSFIINQQCKGYKVHHFRLFKTLKLLNFFDFTSEQLQIIDNEYDLIDWEQMEFCQQCLVDFFIKYFYEQKFEKFLTGEEKLVNREITEHFRYYNQLINVKKSIKNPIYKKHGFCDIDVRGCLLSVIRNAALQLDVSKLNVRETKKQKLQLFLDELRNFDFLEYRDNFKDFIISQGKDEQFANKVSKLLLTVLANGGRFSGNQQYSIMKILDHDLELFHAIKNNKEFCKFRELLKECWNVLFDYFEIMFNIPLPAIETNKQYKRRQEKITKDFENALYKNITPIEKFNIAVDYSQKIHQPPKITKKARCKIYFYFEKQIIDYVVESIEINHPKSIIHREHDGIKCTVIPDVEQLSTLIKEKMNFDIKFKLDLL